MKNSVLNQLSALGDRCKDEEEMRELLRTLLSQKTENFVFDTCCTLRGFELEILHEGCGAIVPHPLGAMVSYAEKGARPAMVVLNDRTLLYAGETEPDISFLHIGDYDSKERLYPHFLGALRVSSDSIVLIDNDRREYILSSGPRDKISADLFAYRDFLPYDGGVITRYGDTLYLHDRNGTREFFRSLDDDFYAHPHGIMAINQEGLPVLIDLEGKHTILFKKCHNPQYMSRPGYHGSFEVKNGLFFFPHRLGKMFLTGDKITLNDATLYIGLCDQCWPHPEGVAVRYADKVCLFRPQMETT